jgi:prevent-host-death family protein
METIAVFEAKSRLSEILAAVELGQEFTVTKRGAPIARIIPYHHTPYDEAAQRARQERIAHCIRARDAAPVEGFDVHAAIQEGRD